MKLQVKKIGTSEGIILPKEFKKFYGIKLGYWLDLSDVIVISNKSKVGQNERN